MNIIYLSLINLCVLSFSRSLSVFGFLCVMSGISVSVRTQCEWAWYWLSGRTYIIYIYSDKHTSVHEEIQFSPPNLSEGGSLCSPIIRLFIQDFLLGGGRKHLGDLLKCSNIGGASGMPNRNHDLRDTKS